MAELSGYFWLAVSMVVFGLVLLALILVGVAGADQEKKDRWYGE